MGEGWECSLDIESFRNKFNLENLIKEIRPECQPTSQRGVEVSLGLSLCYFLSFFFKSLIFNPCELEAKLSQVC